MHREVYIKCNDVTVIITNKLIFRNEDYGSFYVRTSILKAISEKSENSKTVAFNETFTNVRDKLLGNLSNALDFIKEKMILV